MPYLKLYGFYCVRVSLFEYHLKFWNTSCIGVQVRSQLKGRQTSSWSYCSTNWNKFSMVLNKTPLPYCKIFTGLKKSMFTEKFLENHHIGT